LAITKAVIPAAGKGTRLYPATKSQAKEMLPLGTKPVIQHVVEELARAGISEVLIITGRKKRALEDHFDADAAWQDQVSTGGEDTEVWRAAVELFYTRQSEPRGLGDAVRHARAFCGQEPFVVALGDCVVVKQQPGPTVLQRLMETFERLGAACIATYPVPVEQTSRYGILAPAGEPSGDQPFPLAGVVEKPGPAQAPSNWAIAARYVLPPAIFAFLEAQRARLPAGAELQLTDAIQALIEAGFPVYGVPLAPDEFRLDVGDFASYGRSFARMMAMHPRWGPGFLEYLRELLAYSEGRGPDPDSWAAAAQPARVEGADTCATQQAS
jgi:UTP--glucose-1-phosphate uridylyltransferase